MLSAVFLKRDDVLLVTVVNALELLAAADRPVDRIGLDAKLVLNLVNEVERVARLSVHLVYECKNRNVAHYADFEQLSCLRLNAL